MGLILLCVDLTLTKWEMGVKSAKTLEFVHKAKHRNADKMRGYARTDGFGTIDVSDGALVFLV